MKIAFSKSRIRARASGLALALLFVAGAVVSPANAANTPDPTLTTPPAAANLPVSDVAPVASLPNPSSPANGAHSHNLGSLEDKVAESAKNVVKQLGSIDTVSLDDLNTARQTVTKLEVLIEIEKHLAELDKIHNEHSGEKIITAAIPASALSAPPLPNSVFAHASAPPEVSMPSFGVLHDVSRITGTGGHYVATIQGKSVRVGDILPEGSTVVAITPKQVDVKSKDGTIRHLSVKGIDQVYGHTL